MVDGLTAIASEKLLWKPVEFAIARYNDITRIDGTCIAGKNKGVVPLRLRSRCLLMNAPQLEFMSSIPTR